MSSAYLERGMGVTRYEDLKVWQQARALCKEIHCQIGTTRLREDRELTRQLNAASLSIVANIAEGFLRRRRREFIQFLRVAQGSNGEVRALLYLAEDRGYLAREATQSLIAQTNAIGGMIRALESYLKTCTPPSGAE